MLYQGIGARGLSALVDESVVLGGAGALGAALVDELVALGAAGALGAALVDESMVLGAAGALGAVLVELSEAELSARAGAPVGWSGLSVLKGKLSVRKGEAARSS